MSFLLNEEGSYCLLRTSCLARFQILPSSQRIGNATATFVLVSFSYFQSQQQSRRAGECGNKENKELINLSPTLLSGGTTVRPKLQQDYTEEQRQNISSMFYIHFIKTVMEIELSKEIKTYISLELRELLVSIQITGNKTPVCIHLLYEQ